ncbi:hypothetical protein ABZS66_23100 [Dactylosporangium sp. NPDC005572]|uniref:hypothetical protein n=1 Tax=Dactylosporangium sp. NPDC005572 TaxID=3156889 RepID=UPI0033B4E99A
MVTARLAAALLRVAARRWPAAIRADLHREWAAELHVLAESGRPWAMLRYSGSLALARPARQPMTAAMRLRQLWHAVRLVLVAPVAGFALLAVSVVIMNVVVSTIPYGDGAFDPMDLQMPIVTGLSALSALLLARLGRRWSLPDRPATLLAAVTVPPLVICVLVYGVTNSTDKIRLHGPAYLLYFGGLALLLAWAGHRARAGRRRSARWLAIAGAVALADVATMVPVLNSPQSPDPLGAPLWLFVVLTGQNLGIPTWPDAFMIGDVAELDPLFYLVFTGFALGAALGQKVDGRLGRQIGGQAGEQVSRPAGG